MGFDAARLVYPNNWRENIGELASEEDKRFSWFVCGKKYMDSQGFYILSVSPYVQFFSEETGETLVPQGLYERGEGVKGEPVEARLVLMNESHNIYRLSKEGVGCGSKRQLAGRDGKSLISVAEYLSSRYGYDGIALKHQSRDPITFPLCQEAEFVFRRGILVEKSSPRACEVIRYSKQNNSRLRRRIRGFPDCKQIDEALERNPCRLVSKALYDILSRDSDRARTFFSKHKKVGR